MTDREERAAEAGVMLSDEDEASYASYVEEMEAIESGRAMRVVHCYLCHLNETGRPDDSPKADQGPLRGIVREYTSKGFDPYAVYVLTPCGHHII